ncbi:MAG: transcriptional repressor NrdR [Nitrosomonadales bacterium]|nr:transcriptional repressor NrdR [Nitrosomonadales bacterium]
MKCPFCKHEDTQVVDTRLSEEGDTVRRRRRCLSCDKRFTTYEMIELRMPQVVKQNGMRSEFDEERLRTSFARALHKRPVPTEMVDAAIDRVTQKIFALGEREIGSRLIGELVMKELLKLDKVAYIRFASVYKSFQDVGDFTDAIDAVSKAPARRATDSLGKKKS